MAVGEEVMPGPRALYRGGLAGWIHHNHIPTDQYVKGASGRVVRWMRKMVPSLKSGEVGFAGTGQSEPE